MKLGLSSRADLQLGFTPYARLTAKKGGERERASGFGDVMVRYKHRVTSDGARVQIDVIPFVKLPTAKRPLGNGKVEGGIAAPISFALTGPVTMSADGRDENDEREEAHRLSARVKQDQSDAKHAGKTLAVKRSAISTRACEHLWQIAPQCHCVCQLTRAEDAGIETTESTYRYARRGHLHCSFPPTRSPEPPRTERVKPS